MESIPAKANTITVEKQESSDGEFNSDIDTLRPENAAKEVRGSITADSSNSIQAGPINEQQEWEYITGPKLYLVIGTVTLVCFIMLLDTSIVATVGLAGDNHIFTHPLTGKAIPSITSHFHSLGDVGWYGSSYLLAR